MIFKNWVLKCNTSSDVYSKSRSQCKSPLVFHELLIRKQRIKKGKIKERKYIAAKGWEMEIRPIGQGVSGTSPTSLFPAIAGLLQR